VTLVQPDDGVAEVVRGEDLTPPVLPLRVDVAQYQLLPLVGADIEPPASETACRHPLAPQRERVAEGCEHLACEGRILGLEEGPKAEYSLPVEGGAGGMVDGLRLVGDHGRVCVGVAGGERGLPAGRMRGRGVRSHAAGDDGYGRPRGGELVEAGERLGLAVPVEHLDARDATIVSKGEEREGLYLPGAAAGAVGAEARRAAEECIRP